MQTAILQIAALIAALSLIAAIGGGVIAATHSSADGYGAFAFVGAIAFTAAILTMRRAMRLLRLRRAQRHYATHSEPMRL